jgi:CubicO group peptidase (beta-lactamase class C family)
MRAVLILGSGLLTVACGAPASLPSPSAIDGRVRAAMNDTGANGLAIAVIDNGRVGYVQAYGLRNAQGDPLTTDTVMYGASLTKTVLRGGGGTPGEVRPVSRPGRR